MPKRVAIRKSKLPALLAAIGRYQRTLVRYRFLEERRDSALARVFRSDWRSEDAVVRLQAAQIRLRVAWVDLERCKERLFRVIEPAAPRSRPRHAAAGCPEEPAALLPPPATDQPPVGQTSASVKENDDGTFDWLANPLLADEAGEDGGAMAGGDATGAPAGAGAAPSSEEGSSSSGVQSGQ